MSIGADNNYLLKHPMITEYVMLLRDERCGHSEYRRCMKELSFLLAYEILNIPNFDIPTISYTVRAEYSKEDVTEELINSERIALIAILRAGSVMTGSMAEMLPASPIGHLGYYRDRKSNDTDLDYIQLPGDLGDRICWVVDATIATGNTIVKAIEDVRRARADDLKDNNVANMIIVCIVAAPEGILKIRENYPTIPIVICALDRKLDDSNYIVPGVGDAGARLFRTVNTKASPQ